MRALLPLMILNGLLLSSCGEEFAPETLLNSFRVLGMKAEPASLKPGERAQLSALVVDPSRPGKTNTVFWLGCEPDPLNLGRTACSNFSNLDDSSSLGADSSSLPPGMSILGLNQFAAYQAPKTVFDTLSPEDRRRRQGTVGQVLAVALGSEVNPLAPQEELRGAFEKARNKEIGSVLTLFRIVISESDEVNRNPMASGLIVNGEKLPAGWTLRVAPGEEVTLSLDVPEQVFEPYTAYLPAGEEKRNEQVLTSWYSTYGRFKESRWAVGSSLRQSFTAPGTKKEPLPEKRAGQMFVVLRDTRGGQNWKEFQVFTCDDSLPSPRVDSVERIDTFPNGSTRVRLRGERLDGILDVVVGSTVMTELTTSANAQELEGVLASVAPGRYPIVLRGKNCNDVTLSSEFETP